VGFQAMMARARRGLREDLGLYLVAVASLAVAFLGLGAAWLGVVNLRAVRAHWGQSHRMTVYLHERSPSEDVQQLRSVLEGLPSVQRVEHLSADAARQRFLADSSAGTELSALPADAFPASLEVQFRTTAPSSRMREVAQRVAGFGAVSDVETYEGWFDRLAGLVDAGQTLASALALLVLVCAVSVVGNTIRLVVANRRDEIEVLKMCGATDGFVRGPLVLEGAVQGLLGAALAVVLLSVGCGLVRGQLNSLLLPLSGLRVAFLPAWSVVAMLLGGGLSGAVGSVVSIRKYLIV